MEPTLISCIRCWQNFLTLPLFLFLLARYSSLPSRCMLFSCKASANLKRPCRCVSSIAEIIGSRFHCPVCDVSLHIHIGHCVFPDFVCIFFVSSSLSSSRLIAPWVLLVLSPTSDFLYSLLAKFPYITFILVPFGQAFFTITSDFFRKGCHTLNP